MGGGSVRRRSQYTEDTFVKKCVRKQVGWLIDINNNNKKCCLSFNRNSLVLVIIAGRGVCSYLDFLVPCWHKSLHYLWLQGWAEAYMGDRCVMWRDLASPVVFSHALVWSIFFFITISIDSDCFFSCCFLCCFFFFLGLSRLKTRKLVQSVFLRNAKKAIRDWCLNYMLMIKTFVKALCCTRVHSLSLFFFPLSIF